MTNVYTFFSSIGNVGTTTTVLSIADALAKATKVNVGVLNLNAFDDGTDFYNPPTVSLDQLKPKLTGKMFSNENDLLSKFVVPSPNLYILPGNQQRRMERDYSIDEVEYLIERAQDIFDIVLIDAGNHFDNALSNGAMVMTNAVYFIANQQPKAIKRFQQLYDEIIKEIPIPKDDIQLIISNYQDRAYLPTDTDISKQLNLPLLSTLIHVPNGWVSEIENNWKLLSEHHRYRESIYQIVEEIAASASIEIKETPQKKRGFFKLKK